MTRPASGARYDFAQDPGATAVVRFSKRQTSGVQKKRSTSPWSFTPNTERLLSLAATPV